MQPVEITKIGAVKQTAKGDIQYITVRTLDTNSPYDVAVFLNGNKWGWKLGDEVEIEMTGKEFKGKMYFSAPFESIQPLTKPEAPKAANPVDWDSKERRMVRMNSYAHAVKIVEIALATQKDQHPLQEGEVKGLCEMVAHGIEDDIYRDDILPF